MKKTLIKKILIYILSLIIFTALFISSFHLKITIVPVYTYFGILSVFILTILLFLLLFFLKKKYKELLDIKDCFIISLLFFSINLYFFSMVPVTLERSISVFMLNELGKSEYTKEEIEQLFVDKYVYEYEAFEKRFMEQKYTGTIKEENKSYSLSNKGEKMLWLFKIIKKIYNVNGRVLS